MLRVDDGWSGVAFRDYATVEFDVGAALAAAGFPLPRSESPLVTQDDFPFVIEGIRRENGSVFGDMADRM